MNFNYLAWDSDFFGYKIGSIELDASLVDVDLDSLISAHREAGFKLVYLFDRNNLLGLDKLKSCRAQLVDRRVIYQCALFSRHKIIEAPRLDMVKKLPKMLATDDIVELAIVSSRYSRFCIDKRMPTDKVNELYAIWAKKVCLREMAKEVFVIREKGKVCAFLALNFVGKQASVVLIAVDPVCQGKGYGKALIKYAINFLIERGFFQFSVVSQTDNKPACCFYEACGFVLVEQFNIYHLWL